MNSDNTILEKIELYTKGMMSLEERELFEKEIASNEQLQRKVELSMMVDQMVIAKEALKLKDQMRKDLYKSKPNWGAYLGITLLSIATGGAFLAYYQASQTKNQPKTKAKKEDISIKSPKTEVVNNAPILKLHKEVVEMKIDSRDSIKKVYAIPFSHEIVENKEVIQTRKNETIKPVPQTEQKEVTTSVNMNKIDPCIPLQKDLELSVTPSCKGGETGEVHIKAETVKGGKAPYTFILGERQSMSHFDQLASGEYNLWIKDAQNCQVEYQKKVYVPEKICKTNQQYTFNPEYDHSWVIPYDKDKKPIRVVINEKNGSIFYQSQVSNFLPSEWTSESNSGLILSTGLYFFTIEYADGHVDEGSIMVTR